MGMDSRSQLELIFGFKVKPKSKFKAHPLATPENCLTTLPTVHKVLCAAVGRRAL